MYTKLLDVWSKFRSSFWFLPTILMFLATVLAFAMIRFDRTYGQAIITAYPMFEMSPPAARSILSSIVGAMVSTTGVVFSITIVALSLASSQFGSRLIRTYRDRRTSHVTLGIFVSTSLFCILVLASIREIGEIRFVPTASVIIGIILTVVCLATLVYYIHDMSRAIEAPNVIQSSANDLDRAIDRIFPEYIGKEAESFQGREDADYDRTGESESSAPDFSISSTSVGYVQAIQNESLMGVANQHGFVIRLLVQPGDFIQKGSKLANVSLNLPDQKHDEDELRRTTCNSIRKSLIVGPERTHIQDIRYAFNELTEIAVRALSPGINDPFTAINCIDRIHAALRVLSQRKFPSRFRQNQHGELRVIAESVTFEECVHSSLGMIRHYASDSPIVRDRVESALQSLEEQSLQLRSSPKISSQPSG
jgi:uncharacterized membrane protein